MNRETRSVGVRMGAGFIAAWGMTVWAAAQIGSLPAPNRTYWTDVEVSKIEASPEVLELGRKTYEQRCALCHGLKGLGDGAAAAYLFTKPRDFSLSQFKLRSTTGFPADEDLFRTITVGFPAYGMPEFRYLSSEARWGLVHYIKQLGREGFQRNVERGMIEDELKLDPDALTPELEARYADELEKIRAEAAEIGGFIYGAGDAAGLPASVPATPAAIERGKAFYLEMGCRNCHGDTGHGDGPSVPTLVDDTGRKIIPRDFASSPYYFKAGERPQDIVRVLITGMPGTPMPSFDLGPEYHEDIWKLAHYISALSAKEK